MDATLIAVLSLDHRDAVVTVVAAGGIVPVAAGLGSRQAMSDRNARMVYSTALGRTCPTCGWPVNDCTCSRQSKREAPLPARVMAKLRMEKKGRGGKTVTVVYDLPSNQEFLKALTAELKRACGAGGAVVENTLELQGDLRDRVRALLVAKGWTVKG